MMLLFIALCVVVGILYIYDQSHEDKTPPQRTYTPTRNPQRKKQREIIVNTVDEPYDYYEATFWTYIAGVDHHVDETDIGSFVGVVAPEPDNPHDPGAMAVYNMNGAKLMGYIARKEQNDYFDFSKNRPFPCVGYIMGSFNPKYKFYGRLKVIKPYSEDFVKEETATFLKGNMDEYGKDFVPINLRNKYL